MAHLARRRRRAAIGRDQQAAHHGDHDRESLLHRSVQGRLSGRRRAGAPQRPLSRRVAAGPGLHRGPVRAGGVQHPWWTRPARPVRRDRRLRPVVQPCRARRLVPSALPRPAPAGRLRRRGRRDLRPPQAGGIALVRPGPGEASARRRPAAVRARGGRAAGRARRTDGQRRDRVPRVQARGAGSGLTRSRAPPGRTTGPRRRTRGSGPGAGPVPGRPRTGRPTSRQRDRRGGRTAG